MTSNPSIKKLINADFTRKLDNLMPYVNFTYLYTPNMVGIIGIWGNRTFLVLLPKIGEFGQELSDYLGRLRNTYNVQTQNILLCNFKLFSTCKHFLFENILDTVSFFSCSFNEGLMYIPYTDRYENIRI